MVSHKCPQTAATNSKEKMSIHFTNVLNLLFRVYDKNNKGTCDNALGL